MGALLGDEVVYAEEGDFVFKPRNQWHTFWNAGDTPCRILEIIARRGSSISSTSWPSWSRSWTSPQRRSSLGERYGHYFDLERTAAVAQEHGLHFPMPE
jgi:hypothetical protein